MQAGDTSIRHRISTSKPKLLSIVAIVVIATLAVPVILPHITHPSMIYHILLHIVSVIIVIFLTIVSFLAYKRSNSKRMLFMTFGFISLTATEFLYLFHAAANIEDLIVPIVDAELSHVILFVMLTLFGIGVLKVTR